MRFPAFMVIALALLAGGCSQPNPIYQGKTARQWIEALNCKSAAEQQAAIDALVACGPEALPRLTSALSDSDRDIRTGAACVLIRLGDAGQTAVERAMKQGEPHEQISLARACFLNNFAGRAAVEVVMAGLQNEEPKIRHQAIHVLGDLSPASTTAVAPLMDALSSPSADIRWRAANALNRIGQGATAAVPALTGALSDGDARVRQAAAQALGSIGPQATSATEALIAALQDPNEEVRWRAAEVLKAWQVEVRQASHATDN